MMTGLLAGRQPACQSAWAVGTTRAPPASSLTACSSAVRHSYHLQHSSRARAVECRGQVESTGSPGVTTKVLSPPTTSSLASAEAAAQQPQGAEQAPDQEWKRQQGQVQSTAPASLATQQGTRSVLWFIRRLNWSNVRPQEFATSMLFVLGVILVNYGIESMLDYYLGDSPFGSIGCILFGAGVIIYLRLNKIPVSKILLTGFWN